jgi:hypothetical protein
MEVALPLIFVSSGCGKGKLVRPVGAVVMFDEVAGLSCAARFGA